MSEVATLKPHMTDDERAFTDIKILATTLDDLKALADKNPTALQFFMLELDRADTDITLLRTRLRMKRATAHLCSQFGRSP